MSKSQGAVIDNDEPRTVGDILDRLPPPRAAVPAVSATTSAVTPMQMLQIAVERGADLDMLSKLMDLQERWEAGEARKAFVLALNAFKADPPTITKNKHVAFESERTKKMTEYDHATLDQVCRAVAGKLSEHGLSHSWDIEQPDGGMIAVTCVLTHALGHSERVTLKAGRDESGGKNNIQAVASTVSYLQRYTLLSATGLATTDGDDDGRRSEEDFITVAQKETIIDMMKETESDTRKFLDLLNVPSLDELPASRFPEAIAKLEQKRAMLAKKRGAQK